MNIQFFCPMWGLAHLNIGDMFLRIKNAGYDGIEFGFPLNSNLKDGFLKHTKKLSLEIIGQQFDASGNTFNEYKQSLEKIFIIWLPSNPCLSTHKQVKIFIRLNKTLS
jgi:sugar phosphate isomerase/epimerase